jgi:hypothetical protein
MDSVSPHPKELKKLVKVTKPDYLNALLYFKQFF